LPVFDSNGAAEHTIDVFNRGSTPFEFEVKSSAPWIQVNRTRGMVDADQPLQVSVNWASAPHGEAKGKVTVEGTGTKVEIAVSAVRRKVPQNFHGSVQGDGFVSIEAEHFSTKSAAGGAHWERIADYGRTGSSMTVFPVTATSLLPPSKGPSLEYRILLFEPGTLNVSAIVAPTLNFVPGRGLRYAIAMDDEKPQVIDILANETEATWGESVKDSVRTSSSKHAVATAGAHTLKIWMVDPGVVLQKLVVDAGGLKPSYLGPPESLRR
jgi:hypothetical protein